MKTLEQKWIEVLEWAGWSRCAKCGGFHDPIDTVFSEVPPMSLDAVHEIKKKLTDNQLANYSDHLDAIMDRFPRRNKFMPWKSHRELAEGQHCIDALWRTVKG